MSIVEALARAEAHSPFLRRLMVLHPPIVALLEAGRIDDALAAARTAAGDAGNVAQALRIERQGVALALAIADLAGVQDLTATVTRLSDFADRALDIAIAAAIRERTPDAEPRGFAVIALGKHGSRELNYSSDIDPILIFDPETLPRRGREEPVEAAVRIGRRVTELLQTRDGDGYVFRVDLRLRPTPEATPIALPVEAAIGYYESSAVAWERAAFIRARAAAGDRALGASFLSAIRPFVWRRALDFGAVGEIRAMSHRIRDHHSKGQVFGPGYDLKRGRGGIREVEFFAQIHQLIHGGRDPALRVPATLDALAALAAAGRIDGREAQALAAAYRLYRDVEHRLQMVDDQQTHTLPRDPRAMETVAALDGSGDAAALVERLRPHVTRVGAIYDALEDEDAGELPQDPERLGETLTEAGFADCTPVVARIERWRSGTLRTLRSPAAREALEAVLPGLVQALGQAPDPAAAFNRLDDIVEKLPSAINLFRLLEARPGLAVQLGAILSHAPPLGQDLARRPDLLDGLIDASALDLPGTVDELAAAFRNGERGEDYEALLDRVRRQVSERRFALGVQLVTGAQDALDVARGYARVAEAALVVLADAAIATFAEAHGRVPGSAFAVLALGRLGGGVLTHASDLDLIYLHTGLDLQDSDGRKPLGPFHYYNRLAQRISAALSVPTASGPLYEIDTRLRPSGTQGPLCVSLDAFERYQRENAWTWEHMALCRARPVYGSDAAKGEIAAIVRRQLEAPRDVGKLLADARKMRADIARHKPPAGPMDVKLIDGGLVDLEFCLHVLQLRHRTGLDPDLGRAVRLLVGEGLLPLAVIGAHEILARLLITLRLVAPGGGEPPETARALVVGACRAESWEALLADYAAARRTIAECWREISA
ncbi:bifunctional [glutamine synthetase] adenylyltransferase/[glutamine synthetase]-adenylyl-L-tyrosine phosphorylase [Sphingomonas sanxanigenens]|uniref:Glutamate-ammonia ligase adenylyltransferase repeated domain-containing protein n=1 Tax=Sphingomonas sanxanigenens DSM 19645 = NX02 TaxID=1123269 RepID=W0A4B9_9SPHN|nr:bifunctional [glutamine synthetase] adenylyltransferase/[glutamine synthetase]-adenylyl-L-tyrosine phosphorylase [Sphingomonas sanxanigenens]AHE51881.1 hypothetical protein NX02_00570 [Sphingomonas sanxanigenens DSM 19645 = NX02]